MEKLLLNNDIYNHFDFSIENNLERKVIEYSKYIFGNNTIYFDTKNRIQKGEIIAIPDGYLIDFTFENSPILYIIENELASHDVYKHIGEQILKFAVAYKNSGHKLKEVLLKYLDKHIEDAILINDRLKKSNYRNIDAFLEDIIFNKKVGCIVIIDKESEDLENVLNQLSMDTDIIIFQAYKNKQDFVYKFTPFQDDIRESEELSPKINVEELDTIVVPAREEGFNRVFLGENCWYAIKISSSMLSKIKYIAAYQTAPISAITYYAEVDKIVKYKDSNKYILYFKGNVKKLKNIIKLASNKNLALQSPRYTTLKKIQNAKLLDDVFL